MFTLLEDDDLHEKCLRCGWELGTFRILIDDEIALVSCERVNEAIFLLFDKECIG